MAVKTCFWSSNLMKGQRLEVAVQSLFCYLPWIDAQTDPWLFKAMGWSCMNSLMANWLKHCWIKWESHLKMSSVWEAKASSLPLNPLRTWIVISQLDSHRLPCRHGLKRSVRHARNGSYGLNLIKCFWKYLIKILEFYKRRRWLWTSIMQL